jgi:uncharacterized protein (TIGR00290 family)
MGEQERVVLCWSGGKDSALALHHLQRSGEFKIVALFTTIARGYNRISHHGVRTELLEDQADALQTPLHKLYVSNQCTNNEYEMQMKQAMLDYLNDGVDTVAFGDIFLEDLRAYREKNLADVGMKAVFPLWKRDTPKLVEEFINDGFKARLCCVDGTKLPRDFAGRTIDRSLVEDLPPTVDPCGENGEFHSFVFDGPIFHRSVPIALGETVSRDTRYFADLLLQPARTPA